MKLCGWLMAGVAAAALAASLCAQSGKKPTPAGAGWHVLGKDGRGLLGTVTAVAANHFSVKTETGARAVVYFGANTRVLDQHLPAGAVKPVDCLAMAEAGQLEGTLQPVKAAAIQPRDVIVAGGRVDAAKGQVGAVVIARLDPVCAKQAKERAKQYGRTWLAGRVTGIEGEFLTLETVMDPAAINFSVTDTTVVKQRGIVIPVSGLQVGDMVRVDGARKHGLFVAASIVVLNKPVYPRPRGGPVLPRGGPPPQ